MNMNNFKASQKIQIPLDQLGSLAKYYKPAAGQEAISIVAPS
jgi:hypothetical protein